MQNRVFIVAATLLVASCGPRIPPISPHDLVSLRTALCEVQDALAELDQRNRNPGRKLAVVPDEISVVLALTKSRTNQGGLQVNLSPALSPSFATAASVGGGVQTTAVAQGVNTITVKFKHFAALSKDTVLGQNMDKQDLLVDTAKLIVGPITPTSIDEGDAGVPCGVHNKTSP